MGASEEWLGRKEGMGIFPNLSFGEVEDRNQKGVKRRESCDWFQGESLRITYWVDAGKVVAVCVLL